LASRLVAAALQIETASEAIEEIGDNAVVSAAHGDRLILVGVTKEMLASRQRSSASSDFGAPTR